VNVWAALSGDGSIIGPIFYDGNMNGASYLEILIQILCPE